MAFALSLILGAGALSVLSGVSYVWSAPAILMIFGALVSGVYGSMIGVAEFPIHILLSTILLPVAGLLYVAGMGAVLPSYPASGYVLAVLAAGALALAFRPRASEASHEAPSTPAHAAGH